MDRGLASFCQAEPSDRKVGGTTFNFSPFPRKLLISKQTTNKTFSSASLLAESFGALDWRVATEHSIFEEKSQEGKEQRVKAGTKSHATDSLEEEQKAF